ncbi:hypothetical protein QR680_001728 [Steinernema hermaphroditum]|uniref:Major facilitator superfamily (MFS) profile domain-containing protein n=1 Tax=Steinernema hermaphroditum TaxID=289476 RepID=A0AA39GZL3_9BILA|nr:hypothetical protein QR680_001728 [Steinernema hermaphroditum]
MEDEGDGNQQPALSSAQRTLHKDTQVSAWLCDNYASGTNREDAAAFADDRSRKLRFERISGLSSAASESSDESEEAEPKALDGGYGWVIVFVSFVIHFICDGLSFSFGIMFPEIQQYYKASKFTSGIAASLFLAIPLLGGPLAAALTDIYDCRAMTIVGGVIAVIGVALSYFSENVWQFTLTFSLISGLGLCFCYNTAIVIVTYYFEKRRALATGIAVCGSGAGTFTFAPLVEVLIKNFGWRPSILIFSTILLLLVVCGVVMKDVEWPQDTIEYKRRKFIRKMERQKEKERMRSVNDFGPMDLGELRLAVSLPDISTHAWGYLRTVEPSMSMELMKNAVNELEDNVPRSKSVAVFSQGMKEHARNVREPLPVQQRNHSHLDLQQSLADASRRRLISNTSHSLDALDIMCTVPGKMTGTDCNAAMCSSEDSKFSNDGESESSSDDEEYHPTTTLIPAKPTSNYAHTVISGRGTTVVQDFIVQDMPMPTIPPNPVHGVARLSSIMGGPIGTTHGRVPPSNVMLMGTRHSVFGNGIEKAPSAPALCIRRRRRHPGALQLRRILNAASEALKQNWELFTVPTFQFFLLSVFILYMFFDIPYVNFPEYAVSHLNVSESKSSFLVSGIGFFNMISMLFCGFIADWKYTRDYMLPLYGIFISLAGFCVFITPHITSFAGMMIVCNAYGFFISANYVLASVITLELLCLHGFQSGYGLLCLVEGLGNVLGPALVGYFHDVTGSYIYIFYFAGGGITISGIVVLAIEAYRRFNPEVDAQENA